MKFFILHISWCVNFKFPIDIVFNILYRLSCVFLIIGNRISIRNPSHSQTLLDYIRNDLGLTGTKLSCGESGCGSCTVTCTFPDFCPIETGSCQDARTNNISNEFNGHNGPIKDNKVCHHAINACTTKIISLHGMSITTVEGLGCISKVNWKYLWLLRNYDNWIMI